MQTSFSAMPITMSIAAVERDTGLSKDSLRVWERRYGFPTPDRDVVGERSYPFDQVGQAWMQGRLEVFEEHLDTESVQVLLRNALHHLPSAGAGRPRVLLATVPGEPHGLGLLMAEALLALEGCHCTSLGVQTHVWDIVRAAAAMLAEWRDRDGSAPSDPTPA